MTKITLNDIGSLANAEAARTVINQNSDEIERALTNTVSRDGSGPNNMLADLDMDGNHVINTADPIAETDCVNLRTARALANAAAGGTLLPGDTTLRNDLADSTLGKGTDLIGFTDPVIPYYAKTVSDIINGERINVLRAINRNKHAAIRAGTSTEDVTDEIQALFTAMAIHGYGEVFFPRGVYNVTTLTLPGGIRITGQGKQSVIKALTLADNAPMIINAGFGAYIDNDIHISNITFDGNNNGFKAAGPKTRVSGLVAFGRVTNLRLTDVDVRNVQYIGLEIGACRGATLTRVHAYECGWDSANPGGSSAEGGAAIWTGPSGSDQCEDITLTQCVLRNNRWSGLYLACRRGRVVDCRFRDNKEAHIFSGRLPGVVESDTLIISNSHFKGLTKAHISASAIEIGGHNVIVEGNHIEDAEFSGVVATDTHNLSIRGNNILNCGLDTSAPYSMVTLVTTEAAPNQPKNVTIENNRIWSSAVTPGAIAGIEIGNSGAAVENVAIRDNDCTGWTPRLGGPMIAIQAGKFGTGSFRAGNLGTPDANPVIGSFQPSAGNGNKVVSGIGFRPRRLEFRVVQSGSTTDATMSFGTVNAAGAAQCIQSEARTSATAGARSGPAGGIWEMHDSVGGIIAAATFVSYDPDGFTYNVTASAAQPTVHYTAYP